jgi:hypothetical protein
VPELWYPGAAEPSQDDFVERLHRQIEQYTATHGADRSAVEVEFADGQRVLLQSLSPEPGHGFVTLTVHREDDRDPEQLIIPVASIRRIELGPADGDRIRFGFALPAGESEQGSDPAGV